jgi:hypothetical protein
LEFCWSLTYTGANVEVHAVLSGEHRMTGTYKLHLITSTAQLNPKTRQSSPKVSILCPSEGGTQLMKRVLLKKSFETPEEAEREGLAFAQKWIDDGKPDIPEA